MLVFLISLVRYCNAKRKQDFPYTHSDTSRIFLLDNCKFLTDSGRGSLVSTQGGEVIQSDIDPLGGVHLNHPGMIRRPAPRLSRHGAGQISVGFGDLDSVRSLALLLVGRHNYEKNSMSLYWFNLLKNTGSFEDYFKTRRSQFCAFLINWHIFTEITHYVF